MPRQLPWKLNAATGQKDGHPKKNSHASSRTATTVSSRSPAPPHRRNERSTPPASKPNRSPSTSPAPEPPKEEFMIDGVDHDDRYRMVEDEFLCVASQFTKHLHAAEYQRLKGLAKSENAETIRAISRPVTGEMTDLVRRRHAALDTASKQHKGIAMLAKRRASRSKDSDTDEEDLPRQPATYLQGLMDSPRKRVAPLKSFSSLVRSSSFREPLFSITSTTATTIKHEAPTESTSSSDSDDLDSQPPWRSSTALPQEAKVRFRHSTEKSPLVKTEPVEDANPFEAFRARRPDKQLPSTAHQKKPDHSDDEDDPFARSRARKRAREAKAMQQQDIKSSDSQRTALHEIPSFM
ncbi:hypothetical protein QBC43DRAFT_217393 [Cladorrhinum sp. PSN259]|nr:hypothetical protein QBC43DRAFT_217393 [Cladorrhinum sp. PSN259]